jgi:hypothetical protein
MGGADAKGDAPHVRDVGPQARRLCPDPYLRSSASNSRHAKGPTHHARGRFAGAAWLTTTNAHIPRLTELMTTVAVV